MKKLALTSILAVLAGFAMTGSALAVDGAHKDDLSGASGAPSSNICVYCHTPHSATSSAAPLWNRNLQAASSYTKYDSATIDMTINQPRGVSLACLSCHDGTVAYDSYVNGPGKGKTGGPQMTGGHKIGPDLTTEHPVSVDYDTTKDTNFVAAATVVSGGLVLYGTSEDQVECGTCHNPHDDSKGDYLRKSNSNSALCLTCHTI